VILKKLNDKIELQEKRPFAAILARIFL
jgi:hypothetical protein